MISHTGNIPIICMGKPTTLCDAFTGSNCVHRSNGCYTYQARTDSWTKTNSTTKHIEGEIWSQDISDDWGLVVNKKNHVEFTKDGTHFSHISFEGKVFCIDT